MSLAMMNRQQNWKSFSSISVIALLSAACLSTASGQSITNIGVPAGASWSGANAIAGNGSAVAATVDMQSAHRWTGSGLVSIGLLPGSFAATAEDINFDGSAIVGGAFFDAPEETARAYRWTSSGGMQDLGVLSGGFASVGNGISGDGSVVTGMAFDADFATRAFRWTSDGGMQSLGTLSGGTNSEGRRVSNDGSTIVGVSDSLNGNRAFVWTESGGMQDLGLLSSDDESSSAYGVNGDGSIVAGFSGNNATIWTNGIAQSLGSLAGETNGIAYTLSGDGSLVGGYSFQGNDVRATLWSQSLGLVDLNTYLPTLGIDLTGWELGYTRDISFDGTILAGEGTFNGELRGWVVTIPAPGSAGLFVIAGVLSTRRRRV